MSAEIEVKWAPDQMVEVTLNEPDDFLKVRETLTRIGVASRKEKKLYQSCHILQARQILYRSLQRTLCSRWKEGKSFFENDVQRRNRVTQLLSDWGLVNIVDKERVQDSAPLSQIKVLSYKDKGDWTLESKYNIGKKKTD